MLKKTKNFMRSHGLKYKKEYIRPMMAPEHIYVFRFGQDKLNNRVIVRYSHTWTGRLKINEIDLRLHHQHNPRIFKRESELVKYLNKHLASNILTATQQDDEPETPDEIDNLINSGAGTSSDESLK